MPRAPKYLPLAPIALAPSAANLYIGTSGWAYNTWKPGFYPQGIPSRGFLHYYSSRFNTVEVNHTFRKLPESHVLQSWLDATPPGFRFVFKAPEQITHRKRLLECHDETAAFVASVLPAQAHGKLGPLLFQLPPNFKANVQRLSALLRAPALGSDTERLATAIEFRHPSWFTEEVYEVLRQHQAALCVADSDELATPDVVTAHFRYYRMRKSGGYSPRVLSARAKELMAAAQASEVFAFLKHEDPPTGALNALALARKALTLSGSTEASR